MFEATTNQRNEWIVPIGMCILIIILLALLSETLSLSWTLIYICSAFSAIHKSMHIMPKASIFALAPFTNTCMHFSWGCRAIDALKKPKVAKVFQLNKVVNSCRSIPSTVFVTGINTSWKCNRKRCGTKTKLFKSKCDSPKNYISNWSWSLINRSWNSEGNIVGHSTQVIFIAFYLPGSVFSLHK